ncbi:LysM peptidoglycan-binding domain-containing protein [Caloramator sp. E03]|uniref:glycosyl hydrolase family 18 protein n=1 Tax=Caloramator sp. E03 TaxID=2576307 RepID=UPI00111021D5|nr:glycosyl hydrolase family 18 protein [Caloramator sp. E03]QCX33332.1 LysM peptidoglycan-binding domain-containing protein [Caloramator sp. E03]
MIIHVVKPGESLYTIGRLYRVSPEKIAADNELTFPNQLVVGQTLVIKEGTRVHRVMPGESIYSIAKDYKVSVDDILSANPIITNPSLIQPGQFIIIPDRTKKLGTIYVNGYAFPATNTDILKKTFPYLTYLSIFSYEIKMDGSLNTIDDSQIIQLARANNVAPIMVVTNIEEGKGFNSDIARSILTNDVIQERAINNIISTMKEKNYYGLNLDIEYIYPDDREKYNSFINKIKQRLKPLGYILLTSLAPKTSAEQKGLLYEAHDYAAHGSIVDFVILMTYEWGYTYGPPLAVAPINEVKRVLDYAVEVIPSEKILMGIPNYGYDWTLPYRPNTAAQAVSNTAAVELARRNRAAIEYDTKSQSPFFNYYDSQRRQHVVWFEDARSIEAKLLLVNEYKLGGVSYWTIGRFFPQNWLVLSSMYDVKKVL